MQVLFFTKHSFKRNLERNESNMASAVDIGIDLGTASVIVCLRNEGIVLDEPSVVAINTNTGDVLSVGDDAYKMIGRTPDKIRAVRPLEDGVISDYQLTEKMIKYFIRKVCGKNVIKPRICLCVPSGITDVESRAVVEAAASAGARKVFLIEEPVAAALGAGIDISIPNGNMILDIGGGTADIAVLSLNGIVTKTSIKVAGNTFDSAIIKAIRDNHQLLIGEKMAENLKKEIGTVYGFESVRTYDIKGRNLITGLPQKITVTSDEIKDALEENVLQIIAAVHSVIERTPPELVGDIFTNGIVMTGGGSMIHGLDKRIEEATKIKAALAERPIEAVALGTGLAFSRIDELSDGFTQPGTYK